MPGFWSKLCPVGAHYWMSVFDEAEQFLQLVAELHSLATLRDKLLNASATAKLHK